MKPFFFTLSLEETKRAEAWKKRHLKNKICKNVRATGGTFRSAIGGAFTYMFTPTGVGVFVEIKCNDCKVVYALTTPDG